MVPHEARASVGRSGEEIACLYLTRKGYRILERNYRRKWGEIDIVAEKDGIVRFVEVKAVSRENEVTGISREIAYRPEELMHKQKLHKVARTAALYMEERRDSREYQIDGVGVIMDLKTRIARCRLFEQILEENP